MYNREKKYWESGKYEETTLHWCRDPINKEKPEAMFVFADHLLEDAKSGKDNAEAVYLMEKAAKAGHPLAAFALAEMFLYGWGVHKSKKCALLWYERAAELGHQEANEIIQRLRRQKRRAIITTVVLSLIFAAFVAVAIIVIPKMLPVKGVRVHKDSEFSEQADIQSYVSELNKLIEEYDDDDVINGKQGSNRLIVKYEGEGIDLSLFPAVKVIAWGENYLTIQFDNAEDTKKCMEALQKMKCVIAVSESEYNSGMNYEVSADDLKSTGIPYTSSHTGFTHLSWGVEYMGMDQLAAWNMKQKTSSVTVAVIDTGSEPWPEFEDRYLDGVNFDVYSQSTTTTGHFDEDGHGSHVAGTIVDATQGLDVTILPIRVFARYYDEELGEMKSGAPTEWVVAGIYYAVKNGAQVINMSLGGSCADIKDVAVNDAVEKGVVVVVAAGNDRIDTADHCPAHIDSAIVVGACNKYDGIASFSNYGDSVDVAAPGVDIWSYAGYTGAANHPNSPVDGPYICISGTSMAAPHISALAAMIRMSTVNETPELVGTYIEWYCVNMGDELNYGCGIPWAGYMAGK